MESSSMSSRRAPNARMVQNFHLVWLDENIDEVNSDNYRNYITELRHIVNTVNTFTDVDECIDFITDIQEEKTFMIVSGGLTQTIVPNIQDIFQVNCIYIFCENKAEHGKWTKEWPKVKGIYTNIAHICRELERTIQDYDQNSISLGFVKMADGTVNRNLDQLDHSFMYTQTLKEILLSTDFEQDNINDFLSYCQEQFAGNSAELQNIDKIEKEYHYHQPIWWYTYPCFLSSMLNRALRTMQVDLIVKMGFFVRDLHQNIATLHIQQYGGQNPSNSFTVYRGQGLSQTHFDQLMQTKGGLMSFNNFLSTSVDRAVSLAFAESNQYNPDLIGVLFEITIKPSISSSPFASVRNVSYYQEEGEILFSMHSVFRIRQVKQINENDRFWKVELTLTNENDPQLHDLTKCLQEETKDKTGWHRLGNLMIQIGQFNKAEELFEMLLKQTIDESEKAHIFEYLGHIKNQQGKYIKAMKFYEIALEIRQQLFPANHPNLVTSYHNIGEVYHNMDEYSKALSYYEKALEIQQKALPENHPDLATSFNEIGEIYRSVGEYLNALSYYEKGHEICQKTLPADHPDLATSYNNVGLMYHEMGDYSKAPSYFEKAFEIRQKILPANHPDMATSYHNIGEVYHNMNEYSKALSYYKQALAIYQKTLPPDHPDLATSYHNTGDVYRSMRQYLIALPYYEKDLEICLQTLPANHPDLATSYNNIGEIYRSMGEYLNALSYYEKGHEICQKTLPPNHPDLGTSYNNIGIVYNKMGEYSKALSFFERALDIFQSSLPSNHRHLQTVRESVEIIKKKI